MKPDSVFAPSRRSILKCIAWIAFGLLALSAFLYTSLPILEPANPFEQHRRWMARSYAMTATFVVPRIPLPVFGNMSLEAGSYFLLAVAVAALLIADLIVDWPVISGGKLSRGVA